MAPGDSGFRRILAAEVVSNFGSMLGRLAIPWLAALHFNATPFQMGLLMVADVVAGAIGSLLLGAVVDRSRKRAVMLATDIARALVMGTLALLAFGQALAFWILVAASALGGLLTMMFELARSAWVAQRIPADELPLRNSQMAAGTSLSETAAFALGGWLYQGLGALAALAIDALSYLASAACLRGVSEAPAPNAPQREDRSPWRAIVEDIREGVSAVASVPVLRALAGIEVLVELGLAIAGTSYMIFITRDLGFDTGLQGLIFASGGLGSLAGSALAPRLGERFGRGPAMVTGLVLLALGTACIPLAPGLTFAGAVLLVAHQVVGDGGHVVHMVYDRTLRQTVAAPGMLARVDAGIRALGQAACLAGALAGGLFATAFGTRTALFAAAAILTLAAVYAFARLRGQA